MNGNCNYPSVCVDVGEMLAAKSHESKFNFPKFVHFQNIFRKFSKLLHFIWYLLASRPLASYLMGIWVYISDFGTCTQKNTVRGFSTLFIVLL